MLKDVAVPDIFSREGRNCEPDGDAPISGDKGHIHGRDIVASCKLRIGWQVGINHYTIYLSHDEVALVNMEGVIESTSIHDRPFLHRSHLQLGKNSFAKLQTIDEEVINTIEIF